MNMRKIGSLLLVLVILLVTTNVNAVTLSTDVLNRYDVSNAYVCGDYMFDISGSFKPKLHDFMKAARSIPGTHETNPTTLYRVTYIKVLNQADVVEVFSGSPVTSANPLGLLQPAYLYRNHIKDSTAIQLNS